MYIMAVFVFWLSGNGYTKKKEKKQRTNGSRTAAAEAVVTGKN
jgi:hypothetical protein